jgi:3-hydroxyacyl-CoA dehydrogenase
MSFSKVKYSVHDGVAVLQMNNPPVNSLGLALRQSLNHYFKQANADSAVKAIVVIGAANTFCAGADISEFPALKKNVAKGLIDPNSVPLNLLINQIEGTLHYSFRLSYIVFVSSQQTHYRCHLWSCSWRRS